MAHYRSGALSLGLAHIRRELASRTAIALSVTIVLAAAAFLLTSAPRLFEEVTAEDLYATVSDPDPALRNIRVERFGRFGAGPDEDPLRGIRSFGEGLFDDQFPGSVQEIVSDFYYLLDSPRFHVEPLPGEDPPHPFDMFLRFRYQEHIEDHVELIAGSMPTPQEPVELLLGTDCPLDPVERSALEEDLAAGDIPEPEDGEDEFDCRLESVPHYQVAVSAQTAEDMGLEPGQMMLLRPNASDRLFFGVSGQALQYRLAMSISGIIEPTDIDNEYWYADDSLHRPGIQENADLRIIYATGLMAPSDYGSMASAMGEASRNFVWRYFVDPDRVATSNLARLQSELVPFEAHFAPIAARPTDPRVLTQLSDLLAAHEQQRAETLAMMSLTVAGIFSVILVVITMLALLMGERQTRSVVLVRNRGGSAGQISLTRLYEALIMSVPAVTLGYLISAVVFPDTGSLASYRVAVALAAAAVVVLVLAALPTASRRLGDLQREGGADRSPPGMRRVVAEILILVLSVGAVILLRRRGQIDERSTGSDFDLLLAVTPALLGIAAGVIALRLYPIIIRALAWLGSRSRGVVSFVGLRRVLDGTTASWLPVAAIVVCVAAATYSSATLNSIERGQDVSSWQAVGGDFSVKGFGADVNIPTSVDLESLGRIDDVALARTDSGARLDRGNTDSRATMVALDGASYAAMTAGTAGDIELPSFLASPPIQGAGTEAQPIPVLVSADWPQEMEVTVGSTYILDLGRLSPHVVVREMRDRFPDVEEGEPFVVLSFDALASISDLPLPPTVAYLRADESSAEALETGLAAQSSSARLTSRHAMLEGISTDPFVFWVGAGMTLIFVFGALFAVMSALASLAIASARRRRDLGFLRTLGLDSSQATAMTAIEQVPAVLTGTLVGISAGLATAFVLGPAVSLDSFTGNLVPASIVIDWGQVGWLAAALLGVMAIGIVIFVLVNRHENLGRILRVGDS